MAPMHHIGLTPRRKNRSLSMCSPDQKNCGTNKASKNKVYIGLF